MSKTKGFLLAGSGLLVGLLVAQAVNLSWHGAVMPGLLAAVLLFIFWRTRLKRMLVFLLCVTVGWGWVIFRQPSLPIGTSIVESVEIISCSSSFKSYHCVVQTSVGRLTTTLPKNFLPGTIIEIRGQLAALPPDLNFLKGDGVKGRLENTHMISTKSHTTWRWQLAKLRNSAEDLLKNSLAEPAASLSSGLLFGGRQYFGTDFVEAMRRTNTSHLVAVSGFNITLLAEFMRRSLKRFDRRLVFAASTLGILLFVVMIGAPASAVRAAIMGIILLFGTLIGRRPYLPSMIVFTALIMALPNPAILRYDLGFQLSFLAFVGLAALAPALERRLHFIPRLIRPLLATTLGATIATAPLLLQLSNRVSLVGPLVNLLVIPLVPVMMILAGLTLLTALISEGAAVLVGMLLWLPSLMMSETIAIGAALPLATVHWSVGMILGLLVMLVVRRRRAFAY